MRRAAGELVPLVSEGFWSVEKDCWLLQGLPFLAGTEAKLVNEFQANGSGC